ncbi:MAG TPA: response regulator [Longimicrobiales bacterium]
MTNAMEDATIFVVDDDPALLRGLDIALQGRGYAVRTAPSGRALLDLLETERPDLLVMDVMMPGMSGLEVLKRLRSDARWAELPVMMVTAYPHADVKEEAWQGGAGEVVPKPFRLEELLERIERRLGRRGEAEG